MARQLGMVLKTSRAGKDLHALVAQTVSEARERLGQELPEPSAETPVASVEMAMRSGPRRGLRHRLSSFLRGR
jgi:hypothetical protein